MEATKQNNNKKKNSVLWLSLIRLPEIWIECNPSEQTDRTITYTSAQASGHKWQTNRKERIEHAFADCDVYRLRARDSLMLKQKR